MQKIAVGIYFIIALFIIVILFKRDITKTNHQANLRDYTAMSKD
ncbi:MAG: hypothetical protein K0R10_1492 [Alphaproteobacteria bacterium]|jgi:hypothetical protein|nr:hypothetical protein [Alphaproteobacteria bacterium]